jgi:hypothetical protein
MEQWIEFSNESLDCVKKFIYGVHNLCINSSWKYFDKLSGIRRETDNEMTIDKFVSLMKKDSLVYSRLVMGREERMPDFTKYEAITFFQRGVVLDGIERFFWYFCPYNEKNYSFFDNLSYLSFGKRISELEHLL